MEKRVNIIGAGLGGLSLAISLAKEGISSNLISNMPSERAQSVLAEGGINAALDLMGENDSIAEHFKDTKAGGAYLENDKNIENLVNNAPAIVEWLNKLGVPFQMVNGNLVQRNFGGQKKKRTVYAKSSTGKMIMTALIDEARKYEVKGLINRLSHHELVDVEIKNNTLSAIIVKDLFSHEFYRLTGKIVISIGGLNGFFEGHVTGSDLNNANIQALLFSKGVTFRNLEFIQYHPTTIDLGYKRLLVSESARGEGGRLLVYKNNEPYYFMEDRHELGNLAPRDVISKEEFKILSDPAYGGTIYLDLRVLSNDTWKNKLPDLRKEIIDYLSIDPIKDLVPVSPGIHYFMGGIEVDVKHKTSIDNLYAVGECASIYHGANRLGGNSLLGALCGGITAYRTLLEEDEYPECKIESINYQENVVRASLNRQIKDILINSLGIIREEKTLKQGINDIDNLLSNHDLNNLEIARLVLAKAMIVAALERKESRGAHQRSDYLNTSDDFALPTVINFVDGKITIKYEER